MSQILRATPPPAAFGRYWSDQLNRGFAASRELAPDQYAEIRFEDLVREPLRVLGGVGDSFDLDPAGDWMNRAAALIRGEPPRRYPQLSPDDREALDTECREGLRLTDRNG